MGLGARGACRERVRTFAPHQRRTGHSLEDFSSEARCASPLEWKRESRERERCAWWWWWWLWSAFLAWQESIYALTKLYAASARFDEVVALLSHAGPFFAAIAKAKVAKIVRSLLDIVAGASTRALSFMREREKKNTRGLSLSLSRERTNDGGVCAAREYRRRSRSDSREFGDSVQKKNRPPFRYVSTLRRRAGRHFGVAGGAVHSRDGLVPH